jgi:hypothetical protein
LLSRQLFRTLIVARQDATAAQDGRSRHQMRQPDTWERER